MMKFVGIPYLTKHMKPCERRLLLYVRIPDEYMGF